jgi:hypothetical protein
MIGALGLCISVFLSVVMCCALLFTCVRIFANTCETYSWTQYSWFLWDAQIHSSGINEKVGFYSKWYLFELLYPPTIYDYVDYGECKRLCVSIFNIRFLYPFRPDSYTDRYTILYWGITNAVSTWWQISSRMHPWWLPCVVVGERKFKRHRYFHLKNYVGTYVYN